MGLLVLKYIWSQSKKRGPVKHQTREFIVFPRKRKLLQKNANFDLVSNCKVSSTRIG